MRTVKKGVWGRLGAVLLTAAAVAAALFAVRWAWMRTQAAHPPTAAPVRSGLPLTRNYDATEELAEAFERLETDDGLADVQEAKQASQRKIALVFSGLATPAQMQQILRLLDGYEVKAAFFVDGKSAAEDPETVKEIAKRGHVLGNYGLDGEPHPELLTEASLLESQVRTQVILREITGKVPGLYQGNAAEYTPQVRHAAHSAGLSRAVQPSSFLSGSSFSSFSAAMGYVQGLTPGEIVCVKLAGVLDEIEYEPPVEEARPATDPTPSLEQEETQPPEPDILAVVEYLLEALRTTRTPVTTLERLPLDWEEALDALFAGIDAAARQQVPEGGEVPEAYFRDALFIGDSLTQALAQYPFPTGLKGTADICAYRSITPEQIINNVTTENAAGRQVQVLDEICSAAPRRIYILLGMNCLSTQDDAALLEGYGRLLDLLAERFPGVPVYVQGLPPVTRTVSQERAAMTNGRIRDLNVEIAGLARERDFYYLDLYTALGDEEGNLPYFLAQEDGIHLKEEGVRRYVAFLRVHAAE